PGGARFIEVNVITVCLTGVGWLALELRARRRVGDGHAAASFHNLAALSSLCLLDLLFPLRLALDLPGHLNVDQNAVDWLALAALLVVMIACVWERHAKYAVAGLYLPGLLIGAAALDTVTLRPRHLGWAATMVLAIYVIATSVLWRRRRTLID